MDNVDTTQDGTSVGDSVPVTTTAPGQHTASQPAVSTDANLVAQYERRISTLQSQIDKLKNELNQAKAEANKAVMDRAEVQRQSSGSVAELRTQLEQATNATREVLDRETTLLQTNATLEKRIAKLEFLQQHPEAVPFAKLIPETGDQQALTDALETIQTATKQQKETVVQQLRSNLENTTVSATPTKPKQWTPEAIDAYLKGAPTLEERQKRFAEVIEYVNAQATS